MVTLKGTKDGLLIILGNGEWAEVLSELVEKLERPRAAGFFRGAFAWVEPDGWTLTDDQAQELSSVLDAHGMHLDRRKHQGSPARTGTSAQAGEGTSALAGSILEPALDEDRVQIGEHPDKSLRQEPGNGNEHELWSEAAIVRRTVRSGQSIRYPGHVIVYGDVNPGGEIVAGGDVIVWGKLNGVVHAGAAGDETAIVGALQLAAMQLRIGNVIARAPDNRIQNAHGVELARVRDGRIVIEDWTTHRELARSQDWLQSLFTHRRLPFFRK